MSLYELKNKHKEERLVYTNEYLDKPQPFWKKTKQTEINLLLQNMQTSF